MGSIPLPALGLQTPQQPDLLSKYGQLMQLKNMQQQSQMQQQEAPLRMQALQQGVQTGGLQLQEQQQALKDQQSFRSAMQDPSLQGKTIGQVADALAHQGAISQAGWAQAKKADLEHSEAVQKLDTGKLANIKAAHDQTQQLYNNVMDMPDDQLAANWPQIAQQVNSIPGNEKMPLNPNQPMTKQQLGQFGPMLGMANSYLDQELARRKAQTDAKTAEANLGEKQAAAKFYQENGGAPGVPVEAIQQADWLKKNPGKGPSDFVAWKAKQAPLAQLAVINATGNGRPPEDVAKQFGMSPVAFDQTAEKYWTTGTLPPVGRGGAGMALNKALMNRAAEIHPDGSIAANSAEYKANSESLKKLQSSYDTVTAFENTANKNITMLEGIAQKVPDLGVKFANVPIRMLSGSMIGSENMAAFKTALAPVQAESAKILNSANLSGQLSDSSRKELQDIIDGNLPYKSLVASLNVLQQDFENRKGSTADQIQEIQKRLGGKPASSSGQSTNDPFAQFGGKAH